MEQYQFMAGEKRLRVAKQREAECVRLTFTLESDEECLLHWGLARRDGGWHQPPESCWPAQTEPVSHHAVQSLFMPCAEGARRLEFELDLREGWQGVPFVLYFPAVRRWVKDGRADFRLALPRPAGQPSAETALTAASAGLGWRRERFDLGHGDFLWAAINEQPEGHVQVLLATDAEPPLWLHWGLAERLAHEWRLPPAEMQPAGSTLFDGKAVRTPFGERDGVRWLDLTLQVSRKNAPFRGLDFVLYQQHTQRWLKAGGQDLHLALVKVSGEELASQPLQQHRLAEAIIGAEVGKSSLDPDAPLQSCPRPAGWGRAGRGRARANLHLAALLVHPPARLAAVLQHQAARTCPCPEPAHVPPYGAVSPVPSVSGSGRVCYSPRSGVGAVAVNRCETTSSTSCIAISSSRVANVSWRSGTRNSTTIPPRTIS